MRLLLDAGNSRLKWAVLSEGELSAFDSCRYEDLESGPPPAWIRFREPVAVYLLSVATERRTKLVVQRAESLWELGIQQLETQAECGGLRNGYRSPGKLGSDRWAAMLGAYGEYNAPLCVADCGTALTVDVIDGDGQHLGGYIVPGVRLQQTLLNEGTSLDWSSDVVASGGCWGRDTASAISRGASESVAGVIERSGEALSRQLGSHIQTVVTGGDGASIVPLLDDDVIYDPHLVLKGMAIMVEAEN